MPECDGRAGASIADEQGPAAIGFEQGGEGAAPRIQQKSKGVGALMGQLEE